MSSGAVWLREAGACQHDDCDIFQLEMMSDLTVISRRTYGLPTPGWPDGDNTEKEFTQGHQWLSDNIVVAKWCILEILQHLHLTLLWQNKDFYFFKKMIIP